MSSGASFYGYPKPKEVQDIECVYGIEANPVFRGKLLSIGATIVSKLEFIQKYLWANAGFGNLDKLPGLLHYTPRFDPTVIPLSSNSAFDTSIYTAPEVFKSLPQDVPGRYYSVADYQALYVSGALTPLAVAEALLPLIRRDVEPSAKHSVAFIDTKIDRVLKAAMASTQRYQEGKPLGLLDGVPMACKDEVDASGYRTTCGMKMNEKIFKVQEESIWPLRNLEDAGVLMMGKTNMHEIGSDTTNNNPNWGTPRNPYNSQYYTGGSSGGSGYVVAAGLVPVAIGVDGGGSIRIPASFCGVYGLKPTHGRVGESESSVSVIGPIAATISDLEVMYRVMAKPDLNHPIMSLFNPPAPHSGDRMKLIGIYEPWFARADMDNGKQCRAAVEYLVAEQGYQIIPIELPNLPEGQHAHAFSILSEMANHLKLQNADRPWQTDLTAPNKVLVGVGSQTPARDYLLAQQLRNKLMSHLAFLYRKYPGLAIVTPTTPEAGWAIDQEVDLVYGLSDANKSIHSMEYVWLANFTGCPAIACPVGYTAPLKGQGNVPVALMAMGEWGSEDALIEFGRDLETWLYHIYPGGRKRPEVWEDVVSQARDVMEKQAAK
ncbi:MAG: D-lactate ferricytochrome c oxidoreductase [Claussenomyces sp. TS43310]|nr:MAG: D-lactate ferricytochrome c oxidoreductase [Claussenomyces sp. TS43310]